MNNLTKNEELILLAIWRLKEKAYGISIRKKLMETAKRELHYGSLYNTLYLLVKKGYVQADKSDPLPQKGGRSRVVYHLTEKGGKALQEAQEINRAAWKDIPQLVFEGKRD